MNKSTLLERLRFWVNLASDARRLRRPAIRRRARREAMEILREVGCG